MIETVVLSFIVGLVVGAVVMSALAVGSDADDRQMAGMSHDDVASLVEKMYLDGYAAGKKDRG